MIVRSFSDWIFNLLVWGAVVTLAVLSYEVVAKPDFLTGEAGPMNTLICAGVIVVLAALWPRWSG